MIQIYGSTHCGLVRTQNQDSYITHIVDERTAYAAVCDGVGGANGGEVASATACQVLDEHLRRDIRPGLRELTVRNILASAIQAANAKIYQMARENQEYREMGTTLALAVVLDKRVYLAHVGDSRIYICDEKGAAQLTTDHTVVQAKLDRGEITSAEARIHPQRHYITRALGGLPTVDYDYDLYDGFEKDMQLLLCSDGFSNYLNMRELPLLLKRAEANRSAEGLIDYANDKGGRDNITAVVISWA